MYAPLLISAAFGLLKGLISAEVEDEAHFSLEQDLYGPVKEELIFRGAPLWVEPNLPVGTTALAFAVEHVFSDYRRSQRTPTATEVVARLGDTFLGGLCYETAFRQNGIFAAIAAHAVHNLAVGAGARLKR